MSYQEEVNDTPVIKVEYPMEEPVNHWQPTMVHRLPRTFETNQALATHHRVPVRLTTTKPRRGRKVTLNHGNRAEMVASATTLNHGVPRHLPSKAHYESGTNGNENSAVTGLSDHSVDCKHQLHAILMVTLHHPDMGGTCTVCLHVGLYLLYECML